MVRRFQFIALAALATALVIVIGLPAMTSPANAAGLSAPQADAPVQVAAAGTQNASFDGNFSPAASGVQGRIVAWLRLRRGPGLAYKVLGVVKWGAYVDVLGRTQNGFWVQIRVDNTVGWVYKPFLQYLGGDSTDVPVITDFAP